MGTRRGAKALPDCYLELSSTVLGKLFTGWLAKFARKVAQVQTSTTMF